MDLMNLDRLQRLLTSLSETDRSTSVLQRICIVCADSTSADGAGVSRIADGRHEALTASDATASAIEMLQVTLAEGPCLEVMSTFRPALEPDLSSSRAEQRWPNFAQAALDLGVAAAFAFPLMTGGVAIGALDVYSGRVGPIGQDALEDAYLLADLAALAVDQMKGDIDIAGVNAVTEPAEPWAHGATVHNASGMVSQQLGISVDEALLRLRAVAFATERRVLDVARDVVARRLRIDPWTPDGQ
jgi:hypothetical protein